MDNPLLEKESEKCSYEPGEASFNPSRQIEQTYSVPMFTNSLVDEIEREMAKAKRKAADGTYYKIVSHNVKNLEGRW